MDAEHYKKYAVRIRSEVASGVLPTEEDLRAKLAKFGTIWDIQMFHVREGTCGIGQPNNAIVVFEIPAMAWRTLESSRNSQAGSLWAENSMTARPFVRGGYFYELFSTITVPKLNRLKAYGKFPDSSNYPQTTGSRPTPINLGDDTPPAKRRKTDIEKIGYDNTTVTPTLDSSRAPSAALDSPDWMRARITQLETELDSARAARDMAVSEHEVIRQAHQTEQLARREAMSHKTSAEAALGRKEAEQTRLRTQLETALSQKSTLSDEVETLRGRITAVEEELKLAQSALSLATDSNKQVKILQLELEEAQDRVHKLQLRQPIDSQGTNPGATELDDKNIKIKQLKSQVKQLKSDLSSTRGQLESTQQLLESKERKCSSTRRRYESTKAKLGTCKTRLQNERALLQRLKGTLTPEAYRSLGETHETLGEFLSVIGMPPVSEEGNIGPKKEQE